MSPRVHQLGRSNPNGPPFIPSPSAFTHSSPSAFSTPQFGSLSMFGRYYDDTSSGNSSNSNASLEESDHADNRTGDDGRAFDTHGYNTSSNGSGTTLSEYEMGSNDQISNTDPQVEEPDQESHIQESDLVPLPSSRSRTSNNPQRNFSNSYVYSTPSNNVPTTPQQQERQRILLLQQQQQQRFYIPADSDPNFHASRRVMSATTSAFAAAVGRESISRHGHASTGTSTENAIPFSSPAMVPNLASFGFGTAEARTRSERRGLGPPRRERESVHRHVETRTVPPQFRAKTVCKLDCRGCGSVVCMRGMKAMLLADTRVELFSTDCPPVSVQLVGEDYTTRNCRCKIRDVACIGCGGVCGYHITAPCGRCMEACNNGHFWMFHTDGVKSVDRLDGSGNKTLLWASLPVVENDTDGRDVYDRMCR